MNTQADPQTLPSYDTNRTEDVSNNYSFVAGRYLPDPLPSKCKGVMRTDIEVEVEVNLRPTVSLPVRLGIGPPFGTLDQILSCSSFFC
jgi:hypothetical protein